MNENTYLNFKLDIVIEPINQLEDGNEYDIRLIDRETGQLYRSGYKLDLRTLYLSDLSDNEIRKAKFDKIKEYLNELMEDFYYCKYVRREENNHTNIKTA